MIDSKKYNDCLCAMDGNDIAFWKYQNTIKKLDVISAVSMLKTITEKEVFEQMQLILTKKEVTIYIDKHELIINNIEEYQVFVFLLLEHCLGKMENNSL